MSMLKGLRLSVLVVTAIAIGAIDGADAKECKWFGTAPLCDGSCPAGWDLVNYSGDGCIGTWGISGTKAYCCKHEEPCTTYGTPDCPYPPFGSSSSNSAPPSSGPQPSPDVIMNKKKESQSGQGSDGVLVPEPSKGPSPFGDAADSGLVLKKKGAVDSMITTPGALDPKMNPGTKAPENPCGPGMQQGQDGQCYPILR
jgi:hypothetical protein